MASNLPLHLFRTITGEPDSPKPASCSNGAYTNITFSNVLDDSIESHRFPQTFSHLDESGNCRIRLSSSEFPSNHKNEYDQQISITNNFIIQSSQTTEGKSVQSCPSNYLSDPFPTTKSDEFSEQICLQIPLEQEGSFFQLFDTSRVVEVDDINYSGVLSAAVGNYNHINTHNTNGQHFILTATIISTHTERPELVNPVLVSTEEGISGTQIATISVEPENNNRIEIKLSTGECNERQNSKLQSNSSPSSVSQKGMKSQSEKMNAELSNTPKSDKLINECQHCGKTFAKIFNLNQHLRSHTGEKPFHCLICGRSFTQKSNVKKHLKTHKVWPKIKCTLPKELVSLDYNKGDRNLSSDNEFNNGALERTVVVDNSFACQYCEETFINYHKLKSHMQIHKAEKVFRCNQRDCTSLFTKMEGLATHIRSEHSRNLEYECQQCFKMFVSLQDLRTHQTSHCLLPSVLSSNKRKFRCNKCNNQYASEESLNQHLLTSSHYHPCSICHLEFVCERYLRRHLKIHGATKSVKCQQCGKLFKSDNYLKSHLVTHSNEKPFKCDVCEVLFNRRDKLSRHKLIHESRKKYKCDFSDSGCTREFYRKDKLKDHLASHSRKVFVCASSNCEEEFQVSSKLRQHRIMHHPEMFPDTTCSECGNTYKTKHHLSIHTCVSKEYKLGRANNKNISNEINEK